MTMRSFIRELYLNVSSVFKEPSKCIHILNGHFANGMHLGKAGEFNNFIDILSDFGDLIDFDLAAKKVVSGDIVSNHPLIALSFDDGFRECFDIIYKCLNKRSIKGAFFINAGVIEGASDYVSDYRKRVDTYEKEFLTWSMLNDMALDGQIVGSHTLGHYRLSMLNNLTFQEEVVRNKELINERLGFNTDFFAWPYGRLHDTTKDQIDFIKKHHPFIFSGDDYKKYTSFNGEVINRRHVESYWPRGHIKYFISHDKT